MAKTLRGRGGRRLSVRKAAIVACSVCTIAVVFALSACAPQAKSEEGAEASGTGKTAASITTVEARDFTENSSGVFTDTWYNREILNAGNRGCGSCHKDLYLSIKNLSASSSGYEHVIGAPGYDKNYGYRDCTACHFGKDMQGTGPRLEDSLHAIHFSSAEFKENGTCESCHAYNVAGELVLWDDLKYLPELGGYPNMNLEATDAELSNRDVRNSNLADIVRVADFALDGVTLDQPLSAYDDGSEYTFSANNLGAREYDAQDYVVKVSGVNGKDSWTIDEIKALTATEKVFTQDCGGNIQSGPLISTVKATGVTIADFIEACGGLAEGAQTLSVVAKDGWISFGMSWDVATLKDQGSMLAYQYNDHDLTPSQGYPLVLVSPGFGGNCMPKYISELNFVETPGMTSAWKPDTASDGNMNAGWLTPSEDGMEAKVGEEVSLSGWVFEHSSGGHEADKIAISADYGSHWTYIDVDKNLAEYDRDVWVTFEGTWTPDTAGTYVLQLKVVDNLDADLHPVDKTGRTTPNYASVIVKVTE